MAWWCKSFVRTGRFVRVYAFAASAAALAGGCALPAPEPSATVHVADIINSVKCGLAEALQSEAGRRRLPGTIASVELELKVADTRSASANSPSLTGPLVLAWTGPLVLPSLNASSGQSFTVDTVINLTYRLDAPNVAVCAAAGVDRSDRFGFARWLADVIAGLSKVSTQGPRGSLDKLTYDATFAVTREGSAGGSVRVIFLTAGLNADRSRADTQHLKIVISGPSSVALGGSALAVQGRSVTAGGAGGIPNLSASGPASR